jgi:hypothetical protein
MKDFILTQILFLLRLKKTEDRLRIYNGYIEFTLFKWLYMNRISPLLGLKIFKKLRIYSARDIRDKIRTIIEENIVLFNDSKTFFTSFGSPEIIYKSGNRLITDFRNTNKKYEDKIIPIWKIPTLDKDSNIVFFDDLIGTGRQSSDYIKEISGLLNSSHTAYLFSICATEDGLMLINNTTSFSASACDILTKQEHYYTNEECKYFSDKEKVKINEKVELLKSRNAKYNLGLLVAFEHSAPNNTMPLIWKDKFMYKVNGLEKLWVALLPREY